MSVLKRRGKCIASVQMVRRWRGGGQSEIFTVSRRVDPQGREVPPHESKICPPILLSCLLELGREAPAGQGLGGPRQRAGRQVEMREKGRNWGEPWEIQGDP